MKMKDLDDNTLKMIAVKSIASEKIMDAIRMLLAAGMPEESEEIKLLALAGYQLTLFSRFIQSEGENNDQTTHRNSGTDL